MTMQNSNPQSPSPQDQTGGRGRPAMGMGGGSPLAMLRGEKPRDFKGTLKKLIQYLGQYRLLILLSLLLAIGSTMASIVGPKILGNATTKLFAGVMAQIAGTARHRDIGFDFALDRPAGTIALTGARVLTMRGDEIIADATIGIRGNRIATIGPRASTAVPAGARVFDLAGKTIMPGFVDCH